MATKEYKLDPAETRLLKEYKEQYDDIMKNYEEARKFKVGDYVILIEDDNYESDEEGVDMQVRKNSYGTPIKYKVVYVNGDGLPFIKQVSKGGSLIGNLMSMTGDGGSDDFGWCDFRFEMDPDYADAILLGEEYDPAKLHKSKQEMWKTVTQHNKACKVNNSVDNLIAFFDQVKVGDILWNSANSHYVVQEVKLVSKKDWNATQDWKTKSNIRKPSITVLTLKDKKGKIIEVSADYFCNRALYTDRPRSYKELNT